MRVRFVFALLLSLFLISASAETVSLTFATTDFPPFNRNEKGSAAGPFADIVRTICQRMKTRCTIEILPWRRTMAEVKHEEIKGVFPISRLPDREQDYYFIGPILETSFTIYALAGKALSFHRAEDFSGYTIGVYGPSGISKTLEQITSGMPSVTILTELNHITVLKKLSAGRYGEKGIGFVDRDGAQYLIAQEHIANLQAVTDVRTMEFYIGLSRKSVSPEIAAGFMENLEALSASGELAAILGKYGLKQVHQKIAK